MAIFTSWLQNMVIQKVHAAILKLLFFGHFAGLKIASKSKFSKSLHMSNGLIRLNKFYFLFFPGLFKLIVTQRRLTMEPFHWYVEVSDVFISNERTCNSEKV